MPAKKTKHAPIILNSQKDVVVLHKKQMAEMVTAQRARQSMLDRAVSLAANLTSEGLSTRSGMWRQMLDGDRNIDQDCGYPTWITPQLYREMYDREGIAKRVVHCEPEETWAMDPEVYEDEDTEDDTEFEEAWKNLVKKHNIYHHLQRIDVMSGIGQYGVLLIGCDDGEDMGEPVDGVEEFLYPAPGEDPKLPNNEMNLLYLRTFSEEVTFVSERETDPTSPRFGHANMYRIQFKDYPNWGTQAGEIISREVHWTRVLHVADNLKMSEIFGTPRMQPVWNRLYDLRKIYSSSGEAFWKGAFPGLAFEVNPDVAEAAGPIDKEALKKQMKDYAMGLERFIAVTGVTTKSLPPMITDPTNTVETHLKNIAITLGVPYRVLFGSEEAKLASDQDSRAWNKRLKKRQQTYVSPMIISPFVKRLIAFGILPPPDNGEMDFTIDWPDLNAPSDADVAQTALVQTQAISAYALGNAANIIPPMMFLTHIMGFSTEEAEAMLDGAEDYAQEQEDANEQQDEETSEGSLAGGRMGAGDTTDTGDGTDGPKISLKISGIPSNNAWTDVARAAAALARNKTDKAVLKNLHERVSKQVDADPDGSLQCHDSIDCAMKNVSQMPSIDGHKERMNFYQWDEGKWKDVQKEIKSHPPSLVGAHPAVKNLIEDIADGTVNGHSFAKLDDQSFDPYLKSHGVPPKQMNKIADYLEGVYAKVGIHPTKASGMARNSHRNTAPRGRKVFGGPLALPKDGGAANRLLGNADAGGHWVTIEHEHVLIKGGKIAKGPKGLVGKSPDALPSRKGGKKPTSDGVHHKTTSGDWKKGKQPPSTVKVKDGKIAKSPVEEHIGKKPEDVGTVKKDHGAKHPETGDAKGPEGLFSKGDKRDTYQKSFTQSKYNMALSPKALETVKAYSNDPNNYTKLNPTEGETEAVNSYIGVGYEKINERLRDGDFGELIPKSLASDQHGKWLVGLHKEADKDISNLKSIFKKAPPIKESKILYRAMSASGLDSLKAGASYEASGMVSASENVPLDNFIGKNQGGGKTPAILEIHTPKGSKGVLHADNTFELEHLLSHGSKFKVHAIKDIEYAGHGKIKTYQVEYQGPGEGFA